MSQATLGKICADFESSLAVKMAIGATTGTLQNATDDDGVALPTGSYFLTIDGNNSSKEHISCTLTGTSLTAVKTVSRQGVETSGTLRAHRVGAKVVITDFAHIKKINDLLDGTTDFDASLPLKYGSAPTLTPASNEFATVAYADAISVAGAADATTTTKGISKMSVAPASASNPIAVGDNDGRVPTQDENDALVGTSGTPSTSNKFVTNDDTALTGNSKVLRLTAGGKVTTSTIDTGTGNNQIVQLDGSAKLPAVDGSALTSVSKYSNGLTTRAAETASGTQTITHGLGVTPKKVKLTARFQNSNFTYFSIGSFDASGQNCMYFDSTNSGGSNGSIGIRISRGVSDGYYTEGVVSVDATNITITWTRTQFGTGGGNQTWDILWEAFK